MTRDVVVWRAAEPLWTEPGAKATDFPRPAVLRFAGDDFMEQLQAAVAPGGDGLGPLVVAPETWREPRAGLGSSDASTSTDAVRLFQPTHGRFYLVAASLVCRRYGHPDHAVEAGRDERASFLLRRLVPTSSSTPVDPTDPVTFVEHAWVPDGGEGAWQPASTGAASPGEARLPLFPVTSTRGGSRRRLHAGLLPVSRREVFEPLPALPPVPASDPTADDPLRPLADARLRPLQTAVAGLQTVLSLAEADGVPDLAREAFFFALVDLALWAGGEPLRALDSESAALAELDVEFHAQTSWRDLLRQVVEPPGTFIPAEQEPAVLRSMYREELRAAVARLGVDDKAPSATSFFAAAAEALGAGTTVTDPLASSSASGPPRPVYVARCLYERPHCRPADRQVISDPSRTFDLAPFHDPDAPARPVRIVFPVDVSPGGLRKFPRSVSAVVSAELRRQMDRVDADTLREGTVKSPGPLGLGMVCQLSIPIITICALLLLMILVAILNIVFFWLPLFKICLPVPKEGSS